MPNQQGTTPLWRGSRTGSLIRARGAMLVAFFAIALLVLALAPFPSSTQAQAATGETESVQAEPVDDAGLVDPYAGPDVEGLDAAFDQLLGEAEPEASAPAPAEEPSGSGELLTTIESVDKALTVAEPGIGVERTAFGTTVTLDLVAARVAPNAEGIVAIAREGAGDIFEIERGTVDGREIPTESLAYLNEESIDLDYILVQVDPGANPKMISVTLTANLIEDTAEYISVPQDAYPDTDGLFDGPVAAMGQMMMTPMSVIPGDGTEIDEQLISSIYDASKSKDGGTAQQKTLFAYVQAREKAQLTSVVIRSNYKGAYFLESSISPLLWSDGETADQSSTWTRYLPGSTTLDYQVVEMTDGKITAIRIPVDLQVEAGEYLQLQLPLNFNQNVADDLEIELMAGPDVDLEIEKILLPSQEEGRITWEVKVTNNSDYWSRGFTVTDVVPDKYADVRIDASINWSVERDGNSFMVSHGKLLRGETASFQVSAEVLESNECVENSATVTGGDEDPNLDNNTDSDGACPFQIEKTIVDVNNDGIIDEKDTNQPVDGEITRKVSYSVKVTYDPEDPDSLASETYMLTDRPGFADLVTVERGTVTSNRDGYGTVEFDVVGENGWELTPDTPVEIVENTTHEYYVNVYYTPPQGDPSNDERAECRAGELGFGLYNEATVTASRTGLTFTDDACAPIIKDTPIAIQLIKHGDSIDDPLSGAAFGLFSANDDNSLGEQIQSFIGASETHTLAEGVDPGTYFIVETQSPTGYSLLPSPVRVDIARDAQGKATATIDESSQITAQLGTPPDNDTIVITVANVRIGDLPDTGGIGVWPFMIVAAGLFAAAGAMARREA